MLKLWLMVIAVAKLASCIQTLKTYRYGAAETMGQHNGFDICDNILWLCRRCVRCQHQYTETRTMWVIALLLYLCACDEIENWRFWSSMTKITCLKFCQFEIWSTENKNLLYTHFKFFLLSIRFNLCQHLIPKFKQKLIGDCWIKITFMQ